PDGYRTTLKAEDNTADVDLVLLYQNPDDYTTGHGDGYLAIDMR
ncbi:MAG: hypothetical protein UZ08_BCD001002396, partial [Candidatus Parvibacillus calidus]